MTAAAPVVRRRSDLLVRAMSGAAMIVLALVDLWLGGWAFVIFVLIVAAIMAAEWIAMTRRIGPLLLVAGLPYVILPVAALILLRARPDGLALCLWTLVIVWATDIGAYFAGRAIGGPKLAPAISPAKTWAGLGGGVIAAAFAGYVIAAQAGLPSALHWVAAPLAVMAQGGDLFESWLKRRAGVKDSGRLLPGHGGVLDRIDGLVPVATLMGAAALAGLI